jgi:hypothetical protein
MNNSTFLGAKFWGKRNLMCTHEVGKNEEKPIGKGAKTRRGSLGMR